MNNSINHIATYTGKSFDLLNPKPEMVCIEDIAHSLAYQCRYTGHTRQFYSVAQHCVLMAENTELPGDPMVKLLHDAAEAYIGDIAKPWKNLLFVGNFGAPHLPAVPVHKFEQRIQDVVGLALGIDLPYSAEVKESDIRMMATEVRDLMPVMPPSFEWGIDVSNPVAEIIIPWLPEPSEEIFLAMYRLLKLKRTKIC
ncbi:hypothetical protein LCGC14_0923020 [marine sediment metagenome]|uniref:HD domain-containing protein n=1 Tax=marine sediment metagenome TaxID=412755 RepID=A0A0F9NV01_9ZZZZ